ncbi:glycosyltransferase family 2 protein [Candidatus Gottesmanbacteria bacterium]|nr:glycosyltransferase family 2 protein [Candidatus Gottesmanbacteria bacterium]
MISAVVITKNEQEIISRCLSKLKFCNEIIIVDDFSTDNTLKIAKKYTSKIFKHHLSDNFSDQRNFGLRKAKNNWVLFVDSDEIITFSLAKEITSKINNSSNDAYYIKRIDYFFGKRMNWGEFLNKKFIRLIKKNKGKWVRPVHEYWFTKGKVGILNNHIKHYSHSSISVLINKINYYSGINANYLYYQKERGSMFEVFFYPSIKFIHNYILKLGFLDGFYGLIFSMFMSLHSFLSRLKLYFLWYGR